MAMRLKSLIGKFLAFCEKARKPATTANYRWLLNKFLKHVGNMPIDRLKPVDLEMYASTWHEVQSVQRLFQFAVDALEVVTRNVFAKVPRPPARQRRRILSPRDMARYIRRARPSFRLFLVAMRETLARPQEIRALQWEHLQADPDWHDTLEQALAAGRTMFVLEDYKCRDRRLDPTAPRLILVNRRFGRLLLRLKRLAPSPSGAVLRMANGKPWTGNGVRCCMRRLRKHFMSDMDLNKERIVAYTFRHSTATLAAAAKLRDRALADVMGHTSTLTTARYQQLQVEHLRPMMDALERLRTEKREARVEEKKAKERDKKKRKAG